MRTNQRDSVPSPARAALIPGQRAPVVHRTGRTGPTAEVTNRPRARTGHDGSFNKAHSNDSAQIHNVRKCHRYLSRTLCLCVRCTRPSANRQRPQFTARYFQHALTSLGVKHVPTSTYHPQTNGQTEQYNGAIVSRLRHYVAEHQRNWDAFVQPLTYAYNTQVHRSTKCTPIELVTARRPSLPLPLPSMRAPDNKLSAE